MPFLYWKTFTIFTRPFFISRLAFLTHCLSLVWLCSYPDWCILKIGFGSCIQALLDWLIAGLAWNVTLGHWTLYCGAFQTSVCYWLHGACKIQSCMPVSRVLDKHPDRLHCVKILRSCSHHSAGGSTFLPLFLMSRGMRFHLSWYLLLPTVTWPSLSPCIRAKLPLLALK